MKKVLFVCIENSCRSQMAEGFAKVLGEDIIEVYSAGSNPSGKVNPDAVKVMKEAGIDISNQKSKGFRDLPTDKFDYVAAMGCGDKCPFVPAKEHIEWQITDPKGKDMEFFRNIRDNIKFKIEELIERIKEE